MRMSLSFFLDPPLLFSYQQPHEAMALSNDEFACIYASLILADDNVDIKGDKIASILKAANYEIEPYWPGLFAGALEGVKVTDLLKNVGSVAAPGAAAAPAATTAAAGDDKKGAGDKEAAKKEDKKAAKDDSDEGEDMVCLGTLCTDRSSASALFLLLLGLRSLRLSSLICLHTRYHCHRSFLLGRHPRRCVDCLRLPNNKKKTPPGEHVLTRSEEECRGKKYKGMQIYFDRTTRHGDKRKESFVGKHSQRVQKIVARSSGMTKSRSITGLQALFAVVTMLVRMDACRGPVTFDWSWKRVSRPSDIDLMRELMLYAPSLL